MCSHQEQIILGVAEVVSKSNMFLSGVTCVPGRINMCSQKEQHVFQVGITCVLRRNSMRSEQEEHGFPLLADKTDVPS
jgi:hypothetical protein